MSSVVSTRKSPKAAHHSSTGGTGANETNDVEENLEFGRVPRMNGIGMNKNDPRRSDTALT